MDAPNTRKRKTDQIRTWDFDHSVPYKSKDMLLQFTTSQQPDMGQVNDALFTRRKLGRKLFRGREQEEKVLLN